MASYSNSTYSNSLYDLNGVYFNSTSQSSGSTSSVDLDALDARYLIKSSGGTISNNLIVVGSVDVKTSLTLPTIGNVESTIQGKQATINDGDLTIDKTNGLSTTLTTLQTNTTNNESNITTINKNNVIYNSNEYGIKVVSNWISRTIPDTGFWSRIAYSPELNIFVAIKGQASTSNGIMTSSNGIDWELIINDLGGCRDIIWSSKLGIFVIAHYAFPGFSTSTDGKIWTRQSIEANTQNLSLTYSPELNLFVSASDNGGINISTDGLDWSSITTEPNSNYATSIVWSGELGMFVIVYRNGTERVAYSYDGLNWVNVIVSLNQWNSVAWSPQLRLFVAVADSGLMTSADGIHWIDGTISNYSWKSIVWSDLGFFIGIASDGYIMYSNDGFNWSDSVLDGLIRGGCWSNKLGIFVIVGTNIIYTSSLKNRKPTNENIFNNEFNSIDENGAWNFNSLSASTMILDGTNLLTTLGGL